MIAIVFGAYGGSFAAEGDRAESALILFDHLGISAENLNTFKNNSPMTEDEFSLLRKILFHCPRIDIVDIERWSKNQVALDELIKEPTRHRVDTVHLSGYTRSIERLDVPEDRRQRLQFDHYFRIHFQVDDQLEPTIVYCRRIPQSWPLGTVKQPGGFRSSFSAFFLKIDRFADELVPMFVANRAAWHPQKTNAELGIEVDHRTLGVLDMDVGLFDDVKHQDKITHHDRECFYQMLSTVGRLQSVNLQDVARDQFDIAKLLGEPSSQVGLAYKVSGSARRAIKILVNDPDIRERFGIERYYEIEVFVSLPQNLKLIDDATGRSETYVDYPFVFCVRTLPAGMPEGPTINHPIQISGFFLKLWAFRNERLKKLNDAKGDGVSARQTAPLFIGLPPKSISQSVSDKRKGTTGLIVGVGFVVALLFVWGSVYWYSQQDERFRRTIKTKDNIDFTNLDR